MTHVATRPNIDGSYDLVGIDPDLAGGRVTVWANITRESKAKKWGVSKSFENITAASPGGTELILAVEVWRYGSGYNIVSADPRLGSKLRAWVNQVGPFGDIFDLLNNATTNLLREATAA
jgi:hypothetical protein